ERAGVSRAQRGTWAARPGAPGGPRPRREGRGPDRMCAMTVLVAYATHSGATRTLAETLAAALLADGLDTDLVYIHDHPHPRGAGSIRRHSPRSGASLSHRSRCGTSRARYSRHGSPCSIRCGTPRCALTPATSATSS